MPAPRADTLIDLALAEDAVRADVTSRAIFPRGHRSRAIIDAKQDLVVCGHDGPVVLNEATRDLLVVRG